LIAVILAILIGLCEDSVVIVGGIPRATSAGRDRPPSGSSAGDWGSVCQHPSDSVV